MDDFNKRLTILSHKSRTISPFNPVTGHKVIGVGGSMIRCNETEAFPAKPIVNYEIHTNPDTGEVLPDCCESHKEIFNETKEWARKAGMDSLNSEIYAEKVTAQLSYTEYCISELLKSDLTTDDFLKNICEYIEYNIMSFGPVYGGHIHYLNKLIVIVKDNHRIPENERNRLYDYILQAFTLYQWEILDAKELKPLNDAIKEWLDLLPCDLDPFEKVRSCFRNLDNTFYVPVITKKNHYGVNILLRADWKKSLQDDLKELTNKLFESIRGYHLYKSGELGDPRQREINIIIAEDQIRRKQMELKHQDYKDSCIEIIQDWLSLEKQFIERIKPVLQEYQPSKSEIIIGYLQKFGFYDLPMVKALSPDNQEKLVNLFVEHDTPYTIAMFDHLKFLQHLSKEYFIVKDKLNKEISKWFGLDSGGRTVKGNISILNENSKEDKKRYKAHEHKDTVREDYQKLK